MAPEKSVPAGNGPPNLWEQYSKFHDACAAVLDRIELNGNQGIALTENELAELRTMALNLHALGRLLHGKRARDLGLLSERLDRVLENRGREASARTLDGEEPERDPAAVTG
ncbi:MAG: hypothetical protein ACN6PF_24015 [Achromobacter veterisilvae]